MTIRHLDHLFRPRSVTVVGASNRAGSVGQTVFANLLAGGFEGPITPVNPHHAEVAGVSCLPDVEALPEAPELAVICTPPTAVPGVVDALGRKGTRAAVVLTAGLDSPDDDGDSGLGNEMMAAARAHELRILGPNCVGLMVPSHGLNASFAPVKPLPGRVAFVSQSGALATVVLDWATSRGIGFSHLVSLGNAADVDFGDIMDYLATTPDCRAILLYVESIRGRRNFMSAARAAARNMPVLVIKSGRGAAGAKAAQSHTGALAGADEVYDAAFRRAGMLRVGDIDELFAAVETLTRARPPKGERLAILTNGGGLGVMAVDELTARRGVLAELEPGTVRSLDAVLPATWSRGNPVDIIGDAPATRYADTLKLLAGAREVDAVLALHAPVATASAMEAAEAVIAAATETSKTVIASWAGGGVVEPARRRLGEAGLPTYDTPELAVRAFMHLVDYRRNQDQLMQTPPSLPVGFAPAPDTARRIIAAALAEGSAVLSEVDAKRVLRAYGIPVVETRAASGPDEAARTATAIGFPVAVKILSGDITHKTDVGGVRLDLESAGAVKSAAETMLETVAARAPEARIDGFSVQRMAPWRRARELIIGVATDPIFGPVILFGEGGTAVEVIGDRAVALPPLNMTLARDLVSRTRVARLLHAYRDHPPADLDALCLTLVQVSQLVVDIPEIVELDINPIFADETGVMAVDARIVVTVAAQDHKVGRLAIRPYPKELEETVALSSGRRVLLRPIRPEDEPQHYALLARMTPEDIRFRFFGLIGEMTHANMARFTQIDYEREMAFIASGESADGDETLGVVRAVFDPDRDTAEFAIVVRSDMKGQGLGSKLLDKLIAYCRQAGASALVGEVLADNNAMLGLARDFGFTAAPVAEFDAVRVTLTL